MLPLNHENLAECKTTALYRAWKGQLFIQEQRVCDLALCSPFSSTIPAQLPAKLEARYVVAMSDLRKKLPEAAFGKNNYANDEVLSQGVLFSLYEVEILNQNELKVNQLIESLKEKDLALVRYLNERGLLILLTSSALVKEKDPVPDELSRLRALFVISSPRPTRLAAKDLRCSHRGNERSSQVTLVLPALRYALAEAAKDHSKEEVPPGPLVKGHVQEFVTLSKNLLPTVTKLDRPPCNFDQFLKKSDLEAVPGKCSPNSFSRLQVYLSDPQNYTLEMSAATLSSGADSPSPNSNINGDAGPSSGLSSDPVPHEGPAPLVGTTRSRRSAESAGRSREGAGELGQGSERTLQRCRRKSSRLLGVGVRKKWTPLKVLCIMESNKKWKKSKKQQLDLSPTSSKNQGPSADSGEPTLKLKNLQYPLRRKRGAEVLSAEFVQRTKHESAAEATASSEGPDSKPKKSRLLDRRRNSDAEKVEKINKRKTKKKKSIHPNTDEIETESPGDKNNPPSDGAAPRNACPPLRRDECDSHALNMLADLALSSCDTLLLSKANSSSREHRRLQRGKLLRKASDHEYHRMNSKWKGTSLAVKGHQQPVSPPVQPDHRAESASSPQEKGPAGSGKKKSARPHPAKSHAKPPTGTGDFSDPGTPCSISSEHSYASLASEPVKKQLPWRGSLSPPNSKNGMKNTKSGPLVGKVLPFRHQQNICHPHKQFRTYLPLSRSAVMAARQKQDFCKAHKVTFCDQTVRVTCQWEAEYLFNLDSKYTNNSLEKTIIRAVHGPWDVSLSDNMEEMKLILHMWVALFYSKPFKSLTVRKVVEHSNPAKYVSLNSVLDDPLELFDDSEGPFDSEKCPTDSFSEVYQRPGKVEGRACSPVKKPLSCHELSSTNGVENGPPVVSPAETGEWPLKDGQVGSLASDSADLAQTFDMVTGEEPEDEIILGTVISVRSLSGSSLNGQGWDCLKPPPEAEANETVDPVDVFQSSSAPVLPEVPETTGDTQVTANTESAISAEKPETDGAPSSAKEDGYQLDSTKPLRPSGEVWLEANPQYCEDKRVHGGGSDLQDLHPEEEEEDVDGESMELEPIDLALSDSNDADVEPRDVELDQENEELPREGRAAEETCVCDASASGDSWATWISSPALHHTPPKTVTESPGGQEGLTQNSACANQMDSIGDFFVLKDNTRDSLTDSGLPQAVPFHQGTLDEVTALTRIEDSVVSPRHPVSPSRTNLAECSCVSQEDKRTSLGDSVSQAVSQEDVPLESALLQSHELWQVQNSVLPEEESIGNQNASLISAPATLEGPMGDSCVFQKEEGIYLLESAPLQDCPGHQTTLEGAAELLEDKENVAASASDPALPEQIGLDEGSGTAQGEEEINLANTAPCQASHQAIQEEHTTMWMSELLSDAVEEREGVSTEGTEHSVQNENKGTFSVTEEVASGDMLNQVVASMSEEIKSLLQELIDTVSGLEVESDITRSKEDSGLNWMNSVILECVTPPESDEESLITDHLTTSDPRLVANGHLEPHSIFVNPEADSQEHDQCLSASPEGLRPHQMAVVERGPFQESRAASVALDVLSSPSCIERAKLGTPSLDCKFQLTETAVSSKDNDPTVPMLCGEAELRPASQEADVLAREGPSREGCVEILPCVPGGHLVEYPPVKSDSPLHGGPSEGHNPADPEGAVYVQLDSEQTQLPARVIGPHMNWEMNSAEDGQEPIGDPYCLNPSMIMCSRSTEFTGVTGATYGYDLRPAEEISKSDDWMYLEKRKRIFDAESEAKHYDWPVMCRRGDRPALHSFEADGEQRPLKDYINFSVTKKHKDKTRTFHPSKRSDSFMKKSGLINSLSGTRRILDDPIWNILDMECLRFHYKLKQILGNKRPQLSTSSDLVAPQVIAETPPLRKVPEAPVLNLPPRSRSPLLVTIVNPGPRQSAVHWSSRSSEHDDSYDPPPLLRRDSLSKAARPKGQGPSRHAPFHLNKLTYDNKLKECRGDISVIMDEFAELSRVMDLNDRQTGNKGRDPDATSEDAPEKRCPSWPRRTASYEHLFDDLCNTLHFRLKNVAKEACKNPFSFYLVETDDDPFFGRIKNLLKKGGHLEVDPLHFCKASHPETDRLLTIIRNEDIFLHIHKIPSLLCLKRFPSVTFAGVDSPEDILDHSYQELFHSGGFVVSDDQVLATMTTGELKDVVKTLEQLNEHKRWRWLLHYKEMKKLREDARVDSAAHAKDLILRSCQGANFTEVLHYHRCDSRSSPRSEYLNCLLNLQVQHISARLAVFLTETPSSSREALESKGILVLDVSTFLATAQDLATSCRSNY